MNEDIFNPKEDNNINKKNKKKVDIKKSKTKKNEIKEDIIGFEENSLFDSLENKLIQIFTEKGSDIKTDDMNDFKKICSALLIAEVEPDERINGFIKINFTNFQNELDENDKTNLAKKKAKVFDGLLNLSLKKIEAKNDKDFIKQFRDKYGITAKEYKDKEIKTLIKSGKQEKDILIEILKKLNFFK